MSNIISWLHIFLSFMAFKSDVGFYRKRKDLSGVSRSSFVSSFFCSLVIFLYLCDGGGTSSLVLFSVGGGVLVDGWKLWRLLKPTMVFDRRLVTFAEQSAGERESNNFDGVATAYVSSILVPFVVGTAIYNYQFYQYRSAWSWFIGNAANAVYAVGFCGMCPQLYINYRLKSVAHLPVRMFVYKMFNTFVDDVFAFLVEMPLKHRLMTLRDDVVFAAFLYQSYIYRVDKTRANEYGIAFEREEEEGGGEGGEDGDDDSVVLIESVDDDKVEDEMK